MQIIKYEMNERTNEMLKVVTKNEKDNVYRVALYKVNTFLAY